MTERAVTHRGKQQRSAYPFSTRGPTVGHQSKQHSLNVTRRPGKWSDTSRCWTPAIWHKLAPRSTQANSGTVRQPMGQLEKAPHTRPFCRENRSFTFPQSCGKRIPENHKEPHLLRRRFLYRWSPKASACPSLATAHGRKGEKKVSTGV